MFQHIIAFLKKKILMQQCFALESGTISSSLQLRFDNNRWVKSKGESRNIVPKEKYPLG